MLSYPGKVFRFYLDGFRSMTIGKTLWKVILIKLFIMFAILKLFFFPNFLNTKFSTDEQKAGFGPYDDAERNEAAWADGDGDGSICNGGELGDEGDGEIIKWIELSVYPSTQ